jgi:ribosomal-protein-alanine N-acetyltransferase
MGTPTPVLDGERLWLRPWAFPADADAAWAIYGDREVMAQIRPPVEHPAAAIALIQSWIADEGRHGGQGAIWAVERQGNQHEDQQILGTLLLTRLVDGTRQATPDWELGWHFRRSAWGFGYATEAARLALAHGFNTLQLPEIYAVIRPGHDRSARVAQRLGMQFQGTRDRYYGQPLWIYSLRHPSPATSTPCPTPTP